MSVNGLGDAAQFARLRRDGTDLRADLQRLTAELASGQHADLGKALEGDFSGIAGVLRRLELTKSFSAAISDASVKSEGRQLALERVSAELSGVAPHLLSYSANGSLADLALANSAAPDRFQQAVTALNTQIGGVSLFAGDRTDMRPLVSADDMLGSLAVLVAGATTADDVVAAVDGWFQDTGGGYETTAWKGGAPVGSMVTLAEGTRVDIGVTALDPAIRDALSGLALAALVDAGHVPASANDTRRLVSAAAERMQSGEAALIGLRAELGVTEGRIETARARTEATRASLEIQRTGLLEADPYRTATDLEAVHTRLESLYILTARLSRLSLTEFLR